MKQAILKRLEEEFSSRITNTKPYIYAWSENISMDAVLSFLESELTLFEKEVREKTLEEVKEILPKMNVTTRTWNKFFKGTSFEHDNGSKSINIKCAYTNGYNKALNDILEELNTPQEECDNVSLHECPKGIWDGKRHSKRPLGTSQEEEEK